MIWVTVDTLGDRWKENEQKKRVVCVGENRCDKHMDKATGKKNLSS